MLCSLMCTQDTHMPIYQIKIHKPLHAWRGCLMPLGNRRQTVETIRAWESLSTFLSRQNYSLSKFPCCLFNEARIRGRSDDWQCYSQAVKWLNHFLWSLLFMWDKRGRRGSVCATPKPRYQTIKLGPLLYCSTFTFASSPLLVSYSFKFSFYVCVHIYFFI